MNNFNKHRQKMGYLTLKNRKFPVYEGINTIGRDKEATVIIKDLGASHQHALLTIVDDEKHFISDFNSSNGTFVENIKLVPHKLYEINDDSVIIFSLDIVATYTKVLKYGYNLSQQDSIAFQNTQMDENFYAANTQLLDDTNFFCTNNTQINPDVSHLSNNKSSPDQSTFKTPTKLPGNNTLNQPSTSKDHLNQSPLSTDTSFEIPDDDYDFTSVNTEICNALTQKVDLHEIATQVISCPKPENCCEGPPTSINDLPTQTCVTTANSIPAILINDLPTQKWVTDDNMMAANSNPERDENTQANPFVTDANSIPAILINDLPTQKFVTDNIMATNGNPASDENTQANPFVTDANSVPAVLINDLPTQKFVTDDDLTAANNNPDSDENTQANPLATQASLTDSNCTQYVVKENTNETTLVLARKQKKGASVESKDNALLVDAAHNDSSSSTELLDHEITCQLSTVELNQGSDIVCGDGNNHILDDTGDTSNDSIDFAKSDENDTTGESNKLKLSANNSGHANSDDIATDRNRATIDLRSDGVNSDTDVDEEVDQPPAGEINSDTDVDEAADEPQIAGKNCSTNADQVLKKTQADEINSDTDVDEATDEPQIAGKKSSTNADEVFEKPQADELDIDVDEIVEKPLEGKINSDTDVNEAPDEPQIAEKNSVTSVDRVLEKPQADEINSDTDVDDAGGDGINISTDINGVVNKKHPEGIVYAIETAAEPQSNKIYSDTDVDNFAIEAYEIIGDDVPTNNHLENIGSPYVDSDGQSQLHTSQLKNRVSNCIASDDSELVKDCGDSERSVSSPLPKPLHIHDTDKTTDSDTQSQLHMNLLKKRTQNRLLSESNSEPNEGMSSKYANDLEVQKLSINDAETDVEDVRDDSDCAEVQVKTTKKRRSPVKTRNRSSRRLRMKHGSDSSDDSDVENIPRKRVKCNISTIDKIDQELKKPAKNIHSDDTDVECNDKPMNDEKIHKTVHSDDTDIECNDNPITSNQHSSETNKKVDTNPSINVEVTIVTDSDSDTDVEGNRMYNSAQLSVSCLNSTTDNDDSFICSKRRSSFNLTTDVIPATQLSPQPSTSKELTTITTTKNGVLESVNYNEDFTEKYRSSSEGSFKLGLTPFGDESTENKLKTVDELDSDDDLYVVKGLDTPEDEPNANVDKSDSEFDFLAPTQKVVRRNEEDDDASSEDFDFAAPTQKVVPAKISSELNRNTGENDSFDFTGPTQKVEMQQNTSTQDIFDMPTQVICADAANKAPKCSASIFEAATEKMFTECNDTATDLFTAETQKVQMGEAELSHSDDNAIFIQATQKATPLEVSDESSGDNLGARESIFMAATQKIDTPHIGGGSIFTAPTQKIDTQNDTQVDNELFLMQTEDVTGTRGEDVLNKNSARKKKVSFGTARDLDSDDELTISKAPEDSLTAMTNKLALKSRLEIENLDTAASPLNEIIRDKCEIGLEISSDIDQRNEVESNKPNNELPVAAASKDDIESQLEVMFATQTVQLTPMDPDRPSNPIGNTLHDVNTQDVMDITRIITEYVSSKDATEFCEQTVRNLRAKRTRRGSRDSESSKDAASSVPKRVIRSRRLRLSNEDDETLPSTTTEGPDAMHSSITVLHSDVATPVRRSTRTIADKIGCVQDKSRSSEEASNINVAAVNIKTSINIETSICEEAATSNTSATIKMIADSIKTIEKTAVNIEAIGETFASEETVASTTSAAMKKMPRKSKLSTIKNMIDNDIESDDSTTAPNNTKAPETGSALISETDCDVNSCDNLNAPSETNSHVKPTSQDRTVVTRGSRSRTSIIKPSALDLPEPHAKTTAETLNKADGSGEAKVSCKKEATTVVETGFSEVFNVKRLRSSRLQIRCTETPPVVTAEPVNVPEKLVKTNTRSKKENTLAVQVPKGTRSKKLSTSAEQDDSSQSTSTEDASFVPEDACKTKTKSGRKLSITSDDTSDVPKRAIRGRTLRMINEDDDTLHSTREENVSFVPEDVPKTRTKSSRQLSSTSDDLDVPRKRLRGNKLISVPVSDDTNASTASDVSTAWEDSVNTSKLQTRMCRKTVLPGSTKIPSKRRKTVDSDDDGIVITVPKKQWNLKISDTDDCDDPKLTSKPAAAAVKRGRKPRNVNMSISTVKIVNTKKDETGKSNEASVSGVQTPIETPNSTELSQERVKRKLKPKVVFTMLESPELCTLVRRLGGSVVDSIDKATVLITKSVLRSQKLLCAVGQAIPICSPDWLNECKKANIFLDPWDYLMVDEEAENKWNFSLLESYNRSRSGKLFTGYSFQVMAQNGDVVKAAIESCGGKCITRAPKEGMFIVVATADNKSKCARFFKQNITVVLPEAIYDGVLRQELVFEKHLLT